MADTSPASRSSLQGLSAETGKGRHCSESETQKRAATLMSTPSAIRCLCRGEVSALLAREDPVPSRNCPLGYGVHSEDPAGVFPLSPSKRLWGRVSPTLRTSLPRNRNQEDLRPGWAWGSPGMKASRSGETEAWPQLRLQLGLETCGVPIGDQDYVWAKKNPTVIIHNPRLLIIN